MADNNSQNATQDGRFRWFMVDVVDVHGKGPMSARTVLWVQFFLQEGCNELKPWVATINHKKCITGFLLTFTCVLGPGRYPLSQNAWFNWLKSLSFCSLVTHSASESRDTNPGPMMQCELLPPSILRSCTMQRKLPSWIAFWLVFSSVVCVIDALFVLLRPHTLPGGKWNYIFKPCQYDVWRIRSNGFGAIF